MTTPNTAPAFRLAVSPTALLPEEPSAVNALHLCHKLSHLNGLPGVSIEITILGRRCSQGRIAQLAEQEIFKLGIFVEKPLDYLAGHGIDLYLTDHPEDAHEGRNRGLPVARLFGNYAEPRPSDLLTVAFDYDEILTESQGTGTTVQTEAELESYRQTESEQWNIPHQEGPALLFLKWLVNAKQQLRHEGFAPHPLAEVPPPLRDIQLAIITWRSLHTHHRALTSLSHWQIDMNQIDLHLLDGIAKSKSLCGLQPDLFFDDAFDHIQEAAEFWLCAYMPEPDHEPGQ